MGFVTGGKVTEVEVTEEEVAARVAALKEAKLRKLQLGANTDTLGPKELEEAIAMADRMMADPPAPKCDKCGRPKTKMGSASSAYRCYPCTPATPKKLPAPPSALPVNKIPRTQELKVAAKPPTPEPVRITENPVIAVAKVEVASSQSRHPILAELDAMSDIAQRLMHLSTRSRARVVQWVLEWFEEGDIA